MGYLFLSIALIAGAVKGYCGKRTGSLTENIQGAVLLNVIRMILCVLFGTLMTILYNDVTHLTLDPKVIMITALSGISTSLFVVSWLISVKNSAYMMLDIFLMLGSLVPMISGSIFFDEAVRMRQWIGFLVLICAVIIMCSYNNSVKIKLTARGILILFLCGVANGMADFSQKMYVKVYPEMPVSIFNLYTYIFAALTLIIAYFILTKKEKVCFDKNSKVQYVYVLIMSIALFVHSYFKTKSAVYLDSAQLYPLNQGLALIISAFMASAFFKEKLTVKCVVGIAIAFAGLLIMNI